MTSNRYSIDECAHQAHKNVEYHGGDVQNTNLPEPSPSTELQSVTRQIEANANNISDVRNRLHNLVETLRGSQSLEEPEEDVIHKGKDSQDNRLSMLEHVAAWQELDLAKIDTLVGRLEELI